MSIEAPKPPIAPVRSPVRAPKGIINGPVLDAASWGAMVKNLDPSGHRLFNAFGLTMGLFTGRQIMNVLTGATPGGDPVHKDELPVFIQPFHGCLAYNHYSDDPNDRWMKVVDNWIPAFMGAGGAMAGSYHFAMSDTLGGVQPMAAEAMKAGKHMTIDKAELISKFTQSHPWRILAGMTSSFGSASGFQLMPLLNNYGATLSGSFSGVVNRDKYSTPYMPGMQKFISGNIHYYPFGPASMLPRFRDYMLHNPDRRPEQARAMAYAIAEPWFGQNATPERVQAFVSEVHAVRDKFFKDGGIPENLKADAQKEIGALLSGLGLEKTFMKIGLNPAEASVGRNGFIEKMARWMGYDERLTKINEQYRAAVIARSGGVKMPDPVLRMRNHPGDGRMLLVGGAVVGLGVAGIARSFVKSREWHREDNEKLFHGSKAGGQDNASPEQKNGDYAVEDAISAVTDSNSKTTLTSVINDKPLKLLEWATDGLNSSETLGMHRLSCALGLSAGGLAGLKVMEALTGRNFAGAKLPIEKIPEFLRPLYKKMQYNPFSDHPRDRWNYVMHIAIPGVFATAGVIGASTTFFRNRKREADRAEYLDQYDDKMTMAEAKPWTLLTATSSLLATPSGNPFLPIPGINYGMSLGTRFTLSSGRKMIFPGVGEWWTGTASRYPLGPTALRDHMIKYAINNPSKHPDQLDEMAIGILKPWFENITGDQIHSFVKKVEEDRDKFLAEGGVPEDSKRRLEELLVKHFKGAGLEKTLRDIGLDPLEAHLGNNGFSAKVAKFLGAEKRMQEVQHDFTEKYTERLKREQAASASQPSPEARIS